MTSKEIREKAKFIEDSSAVDVEVTKVLFLAEIAAQLAELNEHFRAVDEHVFGQPTKGKTSGKG